MYFYLYKNAEKRKHGMFAKLFNSKHDHRKEVFFSCKAKNTEKQGIFSTTKLQIFPVFIVEKTGFLE